ncbi:hypothetical protein GE21DRAFT_9033 [Neurospora crassa]|uniref:Uncharacterized protein n=1 Tax=Neurospora crassa (strain ATCC 24698 / 74-OR23-1A / CBS 708.71 / DSM 1257 / FGSC 987) TaxID=367110 RepID=V5IM23_NEUCR|nr:hypothetical protein NCU12104 [Neurospora crassa OR74A]ESA42204.1 hypothetical protein NCU12104 [Neurospora crassa OR74A]KHE81631.1 hypothetical protein GE21DRAFT_9033 [Neurospora crassa]|eukprot:XP_011395049.1 hypothetical protein NCU12104 [Neurospora crassa OR74A]
MPMLSRSSLLANHPPHLSISPCSPKFPATTSSAGFSARSSSSPLPHLHITFMFSSSAIDTTSTSFNRAHLALTWQSLWVMKRVKDDYADKQHGVHELVQRFQARNHVDGFDEFFVFSRGLD